MPEIARATIGVDLDGKRIPGEAALLGREAGAAMGDEQNKEWDRRVNAGVDRTGKQLIKSLEQSGQLSGDGFGTKFKAAIDKHLAAVQGGFTNAFDRIKTSAADFGNRIKTGFSDIGTAVEQARARFSTFASDLRATGSRVLTPLRDAFRSLDSDVRTLAASTGRSYGSALLTELRGRAGDIRVLMGRAFQNVTTDAEQVLRGLPSGIAAFFKNLKLDTLGAANGRTFGQHLADAITGQASVVGLAAERLGQRAAVGFSNFRLKAADEFVKFDDAALRAFDRAAVTFDGFRLRASTALSKLGAAATVEFSKMRIAAADLVSNGLAKIEPILQRLPGALTKASLAFADIAVFGKKGLAAVAKDLDGVGKSAEALGKGALLAGDDILKLGTEAGAAAPKAFSLGQAFTSLNALGGVAGIILLVVGLLPELAVLLSATAAGALILGNVLVVAVAGLAGLFFALKNILSITPNTFQGLSKGAASAAIGLQTLIGTFDKTGFSAGKIKLAFEALQNNLLQGLGPSIASLSTTVLPHLITGFGLVGTALGKVLTQFATGLTTPQGLKDLDQFFKNIATELPLVGRLAGSLAGVLVALFNAAAPPATDFLKSMIKLSDQFSAFLHTPTGQSSVQKWFSDMQGVIAAVGSVGASVLGVIQQLSNANNIQNTVDVLNNLGASLPPIATGLGQIGQAAVILSGLILGVATAFASFQGQMTNFIVNLSIQLTLGAHQFQAFFALIGQGAADSGRVLVDLLTHNFSDLNKATAKLAADTKKNLAGMFDPKLSVDELAQVKKAVEDDISSLGLAGVAASAYIKQLTAVPPEVKTQVINDAIKAGQQVADYKSAIDILPKSAQFQILSNAALAKQDLTSLTVEISKLPKSQQFTILDNAAIAGSDVTKLAGLIKALPASQRVQILTDAIQAGADVTKLKGLISQLPVTDQIQILTTAAAAGVPVSALQTLINGLKDKSVGITANTTAGRTLVKAFQGEIDNIKQGKVPGVTIDNGPGKLLIAALQKLIDGLKQKGPPKIDVDPLTGEAHVVSLQKSIDGIKQGTKPLVDVNNAPGLTDTKNLQLAVNALKQGTKPPVDINNGPGLTSSSNLQTAINRIRQGALPKVGVDPQPGITGAGQVQAAIDRITGKSVTVLVSYTTTNSPPAGTRINAHSGAIIQGGVKAFAGGGLNGRDGMLMAGGSNILWAEPETGWEAYISGAAGQSARNISVLMEAARRLGVSDKLGGGRSVTIAPGAVTVISPSADPAQVAGAVVDRLVPHF